MSSNLDPRLQEIINIASSSVSPRSVTSLYVDSAIGNDYQSHSGYMALANREGLELDDFNKTLGSLYTSRHYESEIVRGRISLPPCNIHNKGHPELAGHIHTKNFRNMDSHRQYLTQPYQFNDSEASVDPPSLNRVPDPEPTGYFHGVTIQNPIQPKHQQITPPFTLSNSVHTPPGQRARSSSPFDRSSPTHQLALRREHLRANTHSLVPSQTNHYEILLNESPRLTLPQLPAPDFSLNYDTPTVQYGIKLVPTMVLPDRFRDIFPFQLFNAVQSKCFQALYHSDDNVVISAPTGSGKTALLELAICRLFKDDSSSQFKIVYQAPTKSLCSERVRDWSKKFNQLGLSCQELTGDTDTSEMRRVGNARIIVTTPEKWDSITRKWKDHGKLLQLVKLFLIDEIHILKDTRGATLEAVVSRMKTIGAEVRFVALSATVPNSQDIATWLGKDHTNDHLPAHRETFGEEFRPVKLQKHVYGFDSAQNDYAFDKILGNKLPQLIAKHTHKKPMMVFCFTRKSCEEMAAKLAEWWSSSRSNDRAWPAPPQRIVVLSKDLQPLVGCGVAFHHAGLDSQDRSVVESAFLKGQLNVICCTSTLSVGVNLPCHLVVIKGTTSYQEGRLVEYSDLEVMQMLGRAGRPQFDTSAVAIIMTRSSNVQRYEKMISGQQILESTLHLNLIEHLNSEIGLSTVHDISTAKKWLAGTFLSVRMRQNPNYYKLECDAGTRDPDEKLERVCERDIKLLQDIKVITSGSSFSCTEYGEAMSRYMVQFSTMRLLLKLPEGTKIGQIALSQAAEYKDVRMKPQERASFRELNKSPFIRFPITETISTAAHKVSLTIQVQLGGVELPTDKEFNRRQWFAEKNIIFDRFQSLVRCIVDCRAYDCDAISAHNALEVLRSLSAECWENMPNQLRQVPNLGPAATRKFVQASINSVEKLCALDTASIERILSRNPPFGRKVLDILEDFPRLTLKAEIMGQTLKPGHQPKVHIKACLSFNNRKTPSWNRHFPSLTFMASVTSGTLVHFWRGNIKKLDKAAFPEPPPKCSGSGIKEPNSIMLDHDEEDYDSSDLQDSDLLAMITDAERPAADYDDDDFVNIDDIKFDDVLPDALSSSSNKQHEPVKMDNGRWMCNHSCRGGQATKTGQICKHKCCHEGTEKPRKLSKKKAENYHKSSKAAVEVKQDSSFSGLEKIAKPMESFKFKLKSDSEHHDYGDIEMIDLAHDAPSAMFADQGSRAYRELHKLHSSIQKDESVGLHNNTPLISYAEGDQPHLSFLNRAGESSNKEKTESKEFAAAVDSMSIASVLDNPFDDFVQPDEALAMAKLEDNIDQRGSGLYTPSQSVKSKTPDLTSSFPDGMFDFNAYDADHPGIHGNVLKRSGAENKEERPAKHTRLQSPFQEQEGPEWLKEVDPDILAQFADIVDFV